MASKDEIKELLAALRSEGLGDLADEISKKVEKNERLTNRHMKQLDRYRKSVNSSLNEVLLKYKKYKEGTEALHEVDEIDKKNTEEKIKKYEKLSVGIFSLSKRQTDLEKITNQLNQAKSRTLSTIRETISAIRETVSALNEEVNLIRTLDFALRGLERLYDTWFNVQSELTRAMGQAAMATGGTTRQINDLRDSASGMRELMFQLNGSMIGWADAAQVASDASNAFRMDTDRLSEAVGENPFVQILAAQRGLGLGAQQVATLFRTLQTNIDGGNQSIGDFTLGIREFSDSIGANASQITQEFLDSRDALQRFGQDGSRVFREVATYANHFGFETRRILEMASRFDRFGQASQSINQLNSMFGTTISSFELMQERDPVRRIEMITQAIREQGVEWGQMDFAQQQAIADSLGVETSEAARLMQGESMEEITRQREQQQQEQEKRELRQIAVQETLMGIVQQTSTYFASASDYINRMVQDVSEALGPIFDVIRDSAMESNQYFREWVQSIVRNPEFQEVVHNIADWIRELPKHISEFMPTWNEVYSTAKEMWPVIESIGETIGGMIDFVVEHKSQFVSTFERVAEISERIYNFISMVGNTIGDIGNRFGNLVNTTRSILPYFMQTAISPTLPSSIQTAESLDQIQGEMTRQSVISSGQTTGERLASMVPVEFVGSARTASRLTEEAASQDSSSISRQIFDALSSVSSRMISLASLDTSTPIEKFIEPPNATSSAVDSAPTTSTTATVSQQTPTTARTVMEIISSDVVLNGERVGQAFFQIARR